MISGTIDFCKQRAGSALLFSIIVKVIGLGNSTNIFAREEVGSPLNMQGFVGGVVYTLL